MYLSEIWRYPIKSCGGERLDYAELDQFGIKGDRRWMLIDQHNQMVTQRQQPRMCLIQVKTQPVNLSTSQSGLHVSAPGFDEMVIEVPAHASSVRVKVWQDSCQAWLAAPPVHQWFSDFLGQTVRLVWFPMSAQRQVDLTYAQVGDQVAFADGFPLLLISQASLDNLNARLIQPIEMIRFRPNLVIAGCEAFAEDQYHQLRIGSKDFLLAKPCARCVMPSIDPSTAVKQSDVMRALAYRQREDGVFFGQNLLFAPALYSRLAIEQLLIVTGDEISWFD